MFVRTKQVMGKGEMSMHFALMEARRVNGQPRQRIIMHLGSIKSSEIGTGLIRGFWNVVGWKLDRRDLSDDQRQRIVDRIGTVLGAQGPSQLVDDRKVAHDEQKNTLAACMRAVGVVT